MRNVIDRLLFWVDLAMLWLGEKWGWDRPTAPKNAPQSVSTDGGEVLPEIPPTANLEVLCKAIKDMEGANPANNNEGNCRFHEGGYDPMYGVVRRSPGGFAMFATPALGHLYLRNLLKAKIKNHPTWTIFDLMSNYAPREDNNDPLHYSNFVARRMGVTNSFLIGRIIIA